jgi:deoxyribodipyrimidine photo-lyase
LTEIDLRPARATIERVRALHWFRADLRLRDNRALAAVAAGADQIAFLFVLDERLLASPKTGKPRLRFLHACLAKLAAELERRGQRLVVRRGDPRREVPRVAREVGAERVSWNRDTSPFARRRDAAVRSALEQAGVRVLEAKDRVLFEGAELRTGAGQPFRVFTPFRNAWWRRFEADPPPAPSALRLPDPAPAPSGALPSLAALGAAGDGPELPPAGEDAAQRRLARFLDGPVADYAKARDLPGVDGTSRLSHHLRFGTLSPRACFAAGREAAAREPRLRAGVAKWLDELVWREFYAAILEEHPRVLGQAFRPEFERVRWEDDEKAFAAWCEGRTGYPIVDAGMRQLTETGWMHNRARMIAASFLVKDLLIDWRRGEAWFMQRLVDGDPASNNGGWQWSASTGTDAQPYFRIFSPVAQGERFDPDGAYVRRFVPELRDVPARLVHRPWEAPALCPRYPAPIVDHAERRRLAIRRFEEARQA